MFNDETLAEKLDAILKLNKSTLWECSMNHPSRDRMTAYHLDILDAQLGDIGNGPVLRVRVRLTRPDGAVQEYVLFHDTGKDTPPPERIVAGCNVPVRDLR